MTSDRVLVEVDPESSRFEKGTEKWLLEREALRSDLARELGPGVVQQGSMEQDDKGFALLPIVVALGGAHVFQALSKCFEAWLKYRPGERSLTMKATVDGREITLQITLNNASIEAFGPLMQALPEVFK
jgi:Effector Associated Constant Component 1